MKIIKKGQSEVCKTCMAEILAFIDPNLQKETH